MSTRIDTRPAEGSAQAAACGKLAHKGAPRGPQGLFKTTGTDEWRGRMVDRGLAPVGRDQITIDARDGHGKTMTATTEVAGTVDAVALSVQSRCSSAARAACCSPASHQRAG